MELYSLFISYRGRIERGTFISAFALIIAIFFSAFVIVHNFFSFTATYILYPFVLWPMFSLSAKRLHDSGASSKQLLWSLVPVFGPIYVIARLIFFPSKPIPNAHGTPLEKEKIDYATTGHAKKNPEGGFVVNDVTQMNPVIVLDVFRPDTESQLISFLKNSKDPISIGGGRFSMGGQTASPGSTHVDMRGLNRIIFLSAREKRVRVEAGIRWCDLQKFIDPHNLSVAIMQTYANFTVGGSLGVNCHGRYIGAGPLSLSVQAFKIALYDGEVRECSESENPEIFSAMLGGYGALGIVLEVELNLAVNVAIKRKSKRMTIDAYSRYFMTEVKPRKTSIFHNGDIYPPHYRTVNAVTWEETTESINFPSRLLPIRRRYPIDRVFFWIFSETSFGKSFRERIVDPILFYFANIRWRNREASYDVAELEPVSRAETTYVLQEYFIPVENFNKFVPRMAEIFQRHGVNCINVSIRHAEADPRPLLTWAPVEVFAFVVYYKQAIDEHARGAVAVWTRELIDAAAELKGCYYLPYQPHATAAQLHRVYPRVKKLFELKRKLDPNFRFHNCLWDKYYAEWLQANYQGGHK